MTLDSVIALAAVMAAAAWTPGPNNAMLASSGATYGFRATVPHILGVALGFAVMIMLVGLGLGAVYHSLPWLDAVLHLGGAALLLWIAWRIATAAPPGRDGEAPAGRPFTFVQASAFQWINPKAWAMAVGIGAQAVAPPGMLVEALTLGAVTAAVGLTSASGWAWGGSLLARALGTRSRIRAFNLAMSGLIVLGVIWLMNDFVQ